MFILHSLVLFLYFLGSHDVSLHNTYCIYDIYICNYSYFLYSILYHVISKCQVDSRNQISHTFQKQSQYLNFNIWPF
jgi:hypothetical protein